MIYIGCVDPISLLKILCFIIEIDARGGCRLAINGREIWAVQKRLFCFWRATYSSDGQRMSHCTTKRTPEVWECYYCERGTIVSAGALDVIAAKGKEECGRDPKAEGVRLRLPLT